ncbi:hypothetical protein L4O78_002377 [Pseudomonas aeruginosa]|jgi:hypothetical protein|uniref:Uncharacterized protein n=3 Tax=Pseudomonas TaxID=286 RepID=A0A844NL89_PSEAI|nr:MULTISPECIES: hypothetical protein [Pseudomonas aeruginosa group]EQL41738.1 hypothetical protein M770_08715 [Pseudomonas aeruginosa VRFPA03]SCY89711.1 Uncharacterised protein [Acinetobacter baumannii]AVE35451.1 hypothetical protein HV91_25985 [Pseudomonas aeruginosa]AYL27781.1 hypothetical protein DN073_00025 [Pseudomonas aeruginosa]EIU1300875.1 hypothetical protein [Pseudomonas aeruginosa]
MVDAQLHWLTFLLTFGDDGRMSLKELEPKGIYVHVDELASHIDSKITRAGTKMPGRLPSFFIAPPLTLAVDGPSGG